MKNFFRGFIPTIVLGLLALSLLGLLGCTSTNVSKLTEALAKDPAAVSLDVMTPYGSTKLRRAGCLPGQTTVIAPDGSMTVSQETSNAPSIPVTGSFRFAK